MIDQIKKIWGYIVSIAGLLLAAVFLVERSKKHVEEDSVEKSKFEKTDAILEERQNVSEKRVEEIKKNIETDSKPIAVPDLAPKEVEDYWKKQ